MEKRELQDKPLNEKESLELIANMIRHTQRRVEQGAGAPMLIWGYATVFTTMLVWICLTYFGNYRMGYLWFAIPIIGIVGMLLRKRQPDGVRTYVDKVVRYIWIVLGSTGFLLSSASIFSAMWALPTLFIIILIMGMGSALTGLVIEFKPMVIGGVAGLLISIANYLAKDYDIIMFTFALAFIVMYIIPGHILNYRAKKNV